MTAALSQILHHCCFPQSVEAQESGGKNKSAAFKRYKEHVAGPHIVYGAMFILTFTKTEMILSGVSALSARQDIFGSICQI